jgi:N utilization substance protein B
MAATDRSILRLAAAEILYHTETPVRVALDEAIEIAKKYGMETSGAFVNGILDRIAYGARPSAT